MATETQDPRALLAKMDAEEKAAVEAATKLAEENAKIKKDLLAKLRKADLADVRAKCQMHGFTASQLKGALKTKGGSKTTAATKSPARKTPSTRTKKQ